MASISRRLFGEGGLEDGLEEFAGVVEVFSAWAVAADPQGFIQDPDPLLLGKGWDWDLKSENFLGVARGILAPVQVSLILFTCLESLIQWNRISCPIQERF